MPFFYLLYTNKKFTGYRRLLHSGDYASFKGDVIFYEGRNDTQFKVRGQKVDLLEIDNVVERFPFVEKGGTSWENPVTFLL